MELVLAPVPRSCCSKLGQCTHREWAGPQEQGGRLEEAGRNDLLPGAGRGLLLVGAGDRQHDGPTTASLLFPVSAGRTQGSSPAPGAASSLSAPGPGGSLHIWIFDTFWSRPDICQPEKPFWHSSSFRFLSSRWMLSRWLLLPSY